MKVLLKNRNIFPPEVLELHEVVAIRKWNITASPLPFIDLLLSFPFTADFGDFKVRAPLPEAFFVHKLIAAERRLGESNIVSCH